MKNFPAGYKDAHPCATFVFDPTPRPLSGSGCRVGGRVGDPTHTTRGYNIYIYIQVSLLNGGADPVQSQGRVLDGWLIIDESILT